MKKTVVYYLNRLYAYNDGYKYIINKGSSRSSKTVSLIQLMNDHCEAFANQRVVVWRDTTQSLSSTVWNDFRKLYANRLHFTKQATPMHYPNGSIFEPHYADFTNAHGLTQNWAWLNEPYKVDKDTFDAIDQRADKIFIDYNPKQSHWVDELMKHDRAVVIHSTFEHNPFCNPEQKIKILSYEPYKRGSYEVINEALFYNGQPISDNNQPPPHKENVRQNTANLYNWMVYGLGLKAEMPNKIYYGWGSCSRAEYKDIDATEYFGFDFGASSPSAIVGAKWYDGTLYVDQKHYGAIKYEDSYADVAIKAGVDGMVICDSAKPSIIGLLLQAGIHAIGANKKAGSVVQGIKNLQNVRVVLTAESDKTWSEFNGYEWEVDRYGLHTDKPIKKDDHSMDALRYVFDFMVHYLNINL